MKILILLVCLTLSTALPTIEDDLNERNGRNIFEDIGNTISQAVSGMFNRSVTGIAPLPLQQIPILNRIPAIANRFSNVSSSDDSIVSLDSPVAPETPSLAPVPPAEVVESVSFLDRISNLGNRVRNATIGQPAIPLRDRITNLANRVQNATFINRITDTAETAQSGVTNFLGAVGVLKIIPRECETTSAFLKTGMCTLESKCVEVDGAIAGACERAGVCCVVPIVCGSQVTVKRSWFVNKEFPALVDNVNDNACEVSIMKSEKSIKQIRLDFNHFELGQAVDGSCVEDSLQIFTRDKILGQIDLIPPLCGVNSGQHVYVDMPEGELAELKISVKIIEQKGRAISPRSWRVLVTQLDETEMAPKGCLQYFTEPAGQIKSLNYDADNVNFVSNMNYDICFNKITELVKEAAEAKQNPAAINICRRDFIDVNLEQSFTGESNKMLTPLHTIVKRDVSKLRSESRMADNDDKVITQIQHVVSQLQADKNSGLRTVVENANKLASEKKRTDGKESAKPETNKSSDESKKAIPKKSSPATVDNKGTKVVETKSDVKAPKPENDKKVVKPEETKNAQDITWLILDDGKKQVPVTDTKIPIEKVVNSNVKINEDEKLASKPALASPEKAPAKLEKLKTPEKVQETDFNKVVLGELLAQHDPSKLKNTATEMVAEKPKPEMVFNDEPIALPNADEAKPVITLDDEVQIMEETVPIVKDVEQLTLRDAEEIIKKPACGGAYILVQEREVCGTFVRSKNPEEKDKRFQNAEKISIRSIENPETSLRFSLMYKQECREVAPTTTTTTTTTTTPTTPTTTTTPELVEAVKPTRRVGVIQYLLGWY